MNLQDLKKEVPYKYKPQSVKYGKATMVAYIDARDVQDLLDDVVGPENWATDYRVINENMFCGIGVSTEKGWVWKWDCGVESNVEQEKGEASDAFKRAAVQWGIGRFLYRLGIVELKTAMYKDKEKPATDDGKILWTNDEISEYIRNRKESKGPTPINLRTAPTAPAKYATPAKEPTYSKSASSEDTMKKVAALDKGGVKGKDCIKKYLSDFNKAKGTTYKLSDLTTDDKLIALVDFINNIPPVV
jgi:hypothetical protein